MINFLPPPSNAMKNKSFSHSPHEQNHLRKCVTLKCPLKSKARSKGPVNRNVTHLDFYT